MPINREPPCIEDIAQRLAARIARDGQRVITETIPPASPSKLARRERSLRYCHLPADEKPIITFHKNRAYVPQLAAAIENDPNLCDGARRCLRKFAEYVHRLNRSGSADITVSFLMKALRRSRRTVQRYLGQLERAGYITVEVLHARTRMCAGLTVSLLKSALPGHGWQEKLIKPDAPQKSQNYKFKAYKTKYRRDQWAMICMEGVFRAVMNILPPPSPFQTTVC